MTVGELIAALEKLPPELPVWFSCIDEFFSCEIQNTERADTTITVTLPEDDPRHHGMQPLHSEQKKITVVNLS